jgi:hypothetical protein
MARLGLGPELVWSSELCARSPRLRELAGSELLVALCQEVGADAYISGAGSGGYIDPPGFEAAGIALYLQRYVHPEYPQRRASTFVSHLSVLDALCNIGYDGVRGLVEHEAHERVC